MDGFCVSKCQPVCENGMNIELFAVNYSDFRNLGFGKDKKKSIENIDFKIKPILKA